MKGLNLIETKIGALKVTLANLYKTEVAKIIDTGDEIICNFNHGGWVTRSTTKAINHALWSLNTVVISGDETTFYHLKLQYMKLTALKNKVPCEVILDL